ncbi:MAG: beta-eliminating lyase-related protein [Pseudomonadota bacterium]
MSFASDNWAGASDKVMAVLAEANDGEVPAYGNDPWTGRALDLLSEQFERDVAAFTVSTGSAANGLALASFHKPGGVVIGHVDAHFIRDEAGTPLLYSPGMAVDTVDGPRGMVTADALAQRLADYPAGGVHHGRPTTVSISNVNEIGQCYRASDVAEIAAVARRHGCALHMDGARFVNALAFTKASPADLTWRAGVNVLSLGLTKTGGWCAEVVIFFDPAMREDASYRHKQTGQLLSKNRFAAAQIVALLEDNHALTLATHANSMAEQLGDVLRVSNHATLALPVQSNEVFAYLSPEAAAAMKRAQINAYAWASRSEHLPDAPAADWALHRFVASFRTTDTQVTAVETALRSMD